MQMINGRRVLSTFSAVRGGKKIKMARYADGTTGIVNAAGTRPAWHMPAGPVRSKGCAAAHKPRASRKPPVGGPREEAWVMFTPQFDRM